MKKSLILVWVVGCLLTSCTNIPTVQKSTQAVEIPLIETKSETESTTAATASMQGTDTVPPGATFTAAPSNLLHPVAVTFSSRDGEKLSGTFYPPRKSGAPVVVFMHQFDMDQHQWDAIALWLQNAPSEGRANSIKTVDYRAAQVPPWLDSTWFPPLPEDFSVGVFTFTFRTCENGCQNKLAAQWIMDAEAALDKAATMPGVDASQIITIGTSIGADAALDACYLRAPRSSLRCVGVMTLSPGSYLDMPYESTAEKVAQLGIPVTCFATLGDTPSAEACGALSLDNFTAFLDPGALHGIMMVNAEEESNILLEMKQILLSRYE
jgi:hypothetical protein